MAAGGWDPGPEGEGAFMRQGRGHSPAPAATLEVQPRSARLALHTMCHGDGRKDLVHGDSTGATPKGGGIFVPNPSLLARTLQSLPLELPECGASVTRPTDPPGSGTAILTLRLGSAPP